MNFDRLCLWCMQEAMENGVCSHCGMVPGWTPEPPFALPPGTILHGRYLTGRVLGHGGFGITYLAMDLAEERRVAIKEFLPGGLCIRQAGATQVEAAGEAEDFRYGLVKFLDEARTIYQCQGIPGIISVEKLFEENGTAYYAMEYLEGRDLKHRLEEAGGKLPWQEVLPLLYPVFTALEQVHRMGITHRDISPDNIFLCRDGAVKLLDFGAARSMLQERSQSVDVILKRGYAPEEQYYSRGRQGPWTDVYALGCTVYHCVTGQVPPEATERAYRDECRSASDLCPGLPAFIQKALQKAMAVQASQRFADVSAFRQALYKDWTPKPDPAAPDQVTVPNLEAAPVPDPTPVLEKRPEPDPPPSPSPPPRQGLLGRLLAWLRRLLKRTPPEPQQPWRPEHFPGKQPGGQFGVQPVEPEGWTGPEARQTVAIQGVAGFFTGQWIPVQDTLVLGRNPEACQVVFPPEAPGISRIHCQVSSRPDLQGIFLQDLGSAWGTWLSDSQCLQNAGTFLREGDTFTLGEGNQFVVVIRKEAVT